MPWKPGQSGNPRGRKPNGFTAKDIFLSLGQENGRAYAEQLHALACGPHDDSHVRIKALAIIASCVWGKPTEAVDLNVTVQEDAIKARLHAGRARAARQLEDHDGAPSHDRDDRDTGA